MTKNTHTSGGIFIALIGLNYFITKYLRDYNLLYSVLLIGIYFYVANIASSFPDIDIKSSYISKRHPFIARVFGKKMRHRGFTHSLLFVFILYFVLKYFILLSNNNIVIITISLGFLLGYSSHIFLDLLTSEGVELFYPLMFNVKILPIKTNSKGEKYFHKILKFIILLLVLYNFYIISKNEFNLDLLKAIY